MKHQIVVSLTSFLLFVSCMGQSELPKAESPASSTKSEKDSATQSRQQTTKEDSKRRFDSISGNSEFHSFGKRSDVTEQGEDIIDSKRKFDRISSVSGFSGFGKRVAADNLMVSPEDEVSSKTNELDKRRFDSISGATGFSSFGKRRFDSISGKSSFRSFGKRTSEYPDDIDISQLDKRRFDSISGSSRFAEFGKRGPVTDEGESPEFSKQYQLSFPGVYWLPSSEHTREGDSGEPGDSSTDTETSEPPTLINVDKKPFDRISNSAFSDFGKRPFDRIGSSGFSDFGKRPFDRIGSSGFSDFGKRPFDRIGSSGFSDFGKRPFDRIGSSGFSDFGKRPFDRIGSSGFSDFGKRPFDRIGSSGFSDFGKRPFDRIGSSGFSDFGKRPFDRIGSSGFSDFGKRPFDRISNSAFTDFGKRPFDRISNSAFTDFGKRPFDRISNSAFTDFGKRPFDRISNSAFNDFGKRPFDRISSSGFTSFGKKDDAGSDVEDDQKAVDGKSDINIDVGQGEFSGKTKVEDKRRLDSISSSSLFGGFGKREDTDAEKRRWDRLDKGSAFHGFGKRSESADASDKKNMMEKSSSDGDLNEADKNGSRAERSVEVVLGGYLQSNAELETRLHSRVKRSSESSAPQTRPEASKVKRDVSAIGMGKTSSGRESGIDTPDNENNEPLTYDSEGSYWRNQPIFTDDNDLDEESPEDIEDEKRRFDSISGASDFGGFGKRRFDRIGSGLHGFGKRRFDKISSDTGFGGFGKRRFDKIGSTSNFGVFGKRRFDSIAEGSGFNGFGKRRFDKISNAFSSFGKRRFDRISNAFSSFGKRRFDRIDRGSAFSRFGKRNVFGDDIEKRRFDSIDGKSSFGLFGKRNSIDDILGLDYEKENPVTLDAEENSEWVPRHASASPMRFDQKDQSAEFGSFGGHRARIMPPNTSHLGENSPRDENAEKERQFINEVFERLNELLIVPRARLYR